MIGYCIDCQFWDVSQPGETKRCRFNPPQADPTRGVDHRLQRVPIWPLTVSSDWCGQWVKVTKPVPPKP